MAAEDSVAVRRSFRILRALELKGDIRVNVRNYSIKNPEKWSPTPSESADVLYNKFSQFKKGEVHFLIKMFSVIELPQFCIHEC